MSDGGAPAPQLAGGKRIADALGAAKAEGRAALMPYLMAGYPDHETSLAVADAYVEGGADLIELGIPFSDPLADGPVVHAAATKALRGGATLESTLEVCASVSERIPVVAMGYANMILARGPERFASLLAEAGAVGAIVPDLPPEEGGEITAALREAGLAIIPLVAPNTPPERRARICGGAEGFVYLVSDTRTTGERKVMPEGLADLVRATQRDASVPVAVGFGIGTPEQAAEVGSVADGVIIGSRLVRAVGEADSAASAASVVSKFLAGCRSAS
ncbi:tryptophan synthase subunit alpha [Thermoleophilia bacterium SCSIO 60948]|nr:tryptophan synthase subunit alpha [Thermoleophilia bacterium SCSIO 60948]